VVGAGLVPACLDLVSRVNWCRWCGAVVGVVGVGGSLELHRPTDWEAVGVAGSL
jgi:hypothetical protein